MRKALVFLLLASVTAPAIASADVGDRRGRGNESAQRADDDDDRPSRRGERAARAERSDDDGERSSRREQRRESVRQQVVERRAARGGDRDGPPAAIVQSNDAPATVRTQRSRERFRENSRGAIQEGNRNGARILRDRIARGDAPIVSRVPRAGTQPPARTASRWRNSNQHWRGDWRSDRRYDWRRHRSRYSSLFNFGFYRDPFGWGYQPFSIGWRMWPSYYSSSYWLNDPWQYRLPYAPAGYRWIRYYDDAILVDTWDGRVVDVIRNFFW
jgi:hypothetical protein